LCRNYLLKHVIAGKTTENVEGTEDEKGDGSLYRKTLAKRKRYWAFKEDALNRILWRTSFGRNYGPVIRQIMGNNPKSLKKADHRCIVLKRHRRTLTFILLTWRKG
jgi:hypothetical protein